MTTVHRHHLDGRLGRGLGYTAPGLVVSLSPAAHRELHQILRDLDAAWPRDGEALIVHRARRHAITSGWAADAGLSLTFNPHAARALQRLWLEVLGALADGSGGAP